jgi:hypothetical protein
MRCLACSMRRNTGFIQRPRWAVSALVGVGRTVELKEQHLQREGEQATYTGSLFAEDLNMDIRSSILWKSIIRQ